jgi:predicted  nucleic acid-binding Zn-ribbon protein
MRLLELSEILETQQEYRKLKHKVGKFDDEIDRIQEQIYDLEDEIEGISEKKAPIQKQVIDIEWELGIRVHKDQLKLFDM